MAFCQVTFKKRSDNCSLFAQDLSEHTQACVTIGLGVFDLANGKSVLQMLHDLAHLHLTPH